MKKYIFLLIFFLGFLSSCNIVTDGPKQNVSEIHVDSRLGEAISLKLDAASDLYQGFHGKIKYSKSIETLAKEIETKNNCKTYIYNTTVVAEISLANQTQFCELRYEKDNLYVYDQPSISLEKQSILAPSYFLEYESLNGRINPMLEKNAWYKITASSEDYMSFYTKTNMFIISEDENFTLKAKETIKNDWHYTEEFYIQFKQENQETYVSYRI